MGGRSNSVFSKMIGIIRKSRRSEPTQGLVVGPAKASLGLGQVGKEEERAKKDKKKSNTIRKNRAGTRGAAVPLQSTSTISGDASTKGVQI